MNTTHEEIALLKRKIERERKARKEAELLLEQKSLELYAANERLRERARLKEAILEKTERKFESIIDNAQDLIYRMDRNGFITYANKMCQKKMLYSASESIGKLFTDFIHPDFKEVITRFYAIQRKDKIETTYQEFPAVTKDGGSIWIGQNVQFIYEDGELIEIIAIARDLSEQRTVQSQLYSTTLRLSTLIKATHSGILVEDEHRDIILVNQRFCDFFEIPVPPDQLVGINCATSAEDSKHLFSEPEHFVTSINEILARRVPVVDQELTMTNGRVLERDYIPLFDNKLYKGHVWQYRDITARKESDQLLRINEEKYRSIIENMELGLMEVDANGIIVKAYDRFCTMVGYTQEELIGRSAEEVFLPEEYKEVMRRQDADRERGQGGVYEIEMICKGGRRISVLISGAPVFEGSQFKGTLGVHYDITDRKNLERDLMEAKKIADQAREMEKQFLANMSHEIRNPINAVIGVTNLLYDTPLDAEQLEYVKTIKYSSDVLLQLISGVLDISKIESGKLEITSQPVDIRALVKAIVQTYEFHAADRPIKFIVDIDKKVPQLILGDKVVLNQILLNLLGNAVKFTERGQISVAVRLLKAKPDDHEAKLRIDIRDTGIGIKKDKLKTIFESFKQESAETQLKYGGTGLGLSIVKSLVDAYGGLVAVVSEPGKGACFSVTLPFSLPEYKEGVDVPSATLDHAELTHKRVLVVEDNTVNQVYLAGLLKKWGVMFEIANHGVEALELIRLHRYDLVLMDIRMPEMDGYETTIRIRSDHHNPNANVPIIALTASALVDEKDKALAVGMNHHLTKPFTPEDLLGVLATLDFETHIENTPGGVFHFSEALNGPYLDELYDQDLERAQIMFRIFLKNIEKESAELTERLVARDWKALSALAHKLKPNFGMVGLESEMQLLADIEEDYVTRMEIKPELISKLERMLQSIPKFVDLLQHEQRRLEEALLSAEKP